MAHWECRYCDSPFGPVKVGDEEVCRCGAEWADAKILVEDEPEYESLYGDDDDDFMHDEPGDWEDEGDESYTEGGDDWPDDRLPCGCCACCGCSCDNDCVEDGED